MPRRGPLACTYEPPKMGYELLDGEHPACILIAYTAGWPGGSDCRMRFGGGRSFCYCPGFTSVIHPAHHQQSVRATNTQGSSTQLPGRTILPLWEGACWGVQFTKGFHRHASGLARCGRSASGLATFNHPLTSTKQRGPKSIFSPTSFRLVRALLLGPGTLLIAIAPTLVANDLTRTSHWLSLRCTTASPSPRHPPGSAHVRSARVSDAWPARRIHTRRIDCA